LKNSERAVAVVRQIAAAYHAGLVAFDTADENVRRKQ
jgi:hypothetical protein